MDSQRLVSLAQSLQEKAVGYRRDFHRHAETAWTEFRTAAKVANVLAEQGFEVLIGDEVIDSAAMMGVPLDTELERHAHRALEQGADPAWLERMGGGKTGVVGVLKSGEPGPTLALRFDMDANDAIEAADINHRPYREGFASINEGAMHACAHDGHTAVGLVVAEMLAAVKGSWPGAVKLIFQPAEEGVRGAKAMTAKGIVDDVDYLLGMHFGVSLGRLGQVACSTEGFLATTKIDASFTGIPAHAGAAPETGRNALLAAASAALNLHAISRHGKGASRINVGVLQAGTGRNVIPANAVLKLETRGTTSEINEYILNEATRILNASAAMYDVKLETREMGSAAGCKNDQALTSRIRQAVQHSGLFSDIVAAGNIGGSEDCTYFMERVQARGGMAAYIMVGTELAAGHHDFRFDFNEEALWMAAALLAIIAVDILNRPVAK